MSLHPSEEIVTPFSKIKIQGYKLLSLLKALGQGAPQINVCGKGLYSFEMEFVQRISSPRGSGSAGQRRKRSSVIPRPRSDRTYPAASGGS